MFCWRRKHECAILCGMGGGDALRSEIDRYRTKARVFSVEFRQKEKTFLGLNFVQPSQWVVFYFSCIQASTTPLPLVYRLCYKMLDFNGQDSSLSYTFETSVWYSMVPLKMTECQYCCCIPNICFRYCLDNMSCNFYTTWLKVWWLAQCFMHWGPLPENEVQVCTLLKTLFWHPLVFSLF